MPFANNPRIIVELEAGGDPIRGSIEHADGRQHAFWGWLELIEELRRVAADEPERPSLAMPADIQAARHGKTRMPASVPAPTPHAGRIRRRGHSVGGGR